MKRATVFVRTRLNKWLHDNFIVYAKIENKDFSNMKPDEEREV